MDALHARYPFLAAAREAVETADVDLPEVATAGDPVVERALDRVRTAIESGDVGDPRRTPRVELLSYPVARVLVSLVDEPGLIRRYARAEAATAIERLRGDVGDDTELRSVDRTRLTLDAFLREFDLADAVTETPEGFEVGVATYLDLAGDLSGERWRLVRRGLADGAVPVTTDELYALLRAAVQERVAAGLPLDVPDPIAESLDDAVAEIRERLADRELPQLDTVAPACYPPCVDALLERVDDGGAVPPRSRFSLAAFLVAIGMPTDDVVDRLAGHPDIDPERVRDQVAHLRDDGDVEYPPPSCATVQAYGDCANENRGLEDPLCERVAHPLEYYERRLEGDQASRRPESQ